MDDLLKTWLEVSPPLGSEDLRARVQRAVTDWKQMPPAVQVEYAGAVEEHTEGLSAEWKGRYATELAALEKTWDDMQQAIADRHISVYEFKDRPVGYTFVGQGNDDQGVIKWIVCGTNQFTQDYMSVEKETQFEWFNKKYQRVTGERTPFREIHAMDEKYKDARFQRVVKLTAPKQDSGWVQLK
jgi:hypothetical protein